ncbi:hypothetical protein [Dyella tabacisoli]|nr:hypothetical protein [Dyella tabacisoli]
MVLTDEVLTGADAFNKAASVLVVTQVSVAANADAENIASETANGSKARR